MEKNGQRRLKIFRTYNNEKLDFGTFGDVFAGRMLCSSLPTAVKIFNKPPKNGHPCLNIIKLLNKVDTKRSELEKALPLAFKRLRNVHSIRDNLKFIERRDPVLFQEINRILRDFRNKNIKEEKPICETKAVLRNALRSHLLNLHCFCLGITLARILLSNVRALTNAELMPYVTREKLPDFSNPEMSVEIITGLKWRVIYDRYIKDSPHFKRLSPGLQESLTHFILADKPLEESITPLLSALNTSIASAEATQVKTPSDEMSK